MLIRTKKYAAISAIALTALVLSGCSDEPTASDSKSGAGTTIDVRFGHLYETSHPFHSCGAEPFAQALNDSGLGFNAQVFPAGQLGAEQEEIQSVAAGDLEITMGGPGAVANWSDEIGVLDAAYVVDDWDHMQRVWDGEIGEGLRAGLSEGGIEPIDLWFYGTRHLTTSGAPVHGPDDIAGKKIRAIDTPTSLANSKAMGASPVPVSFDELYIALSQGVVDGQENPIPTIESLKLYEVQDNLNLTGHLLQSSVMVASPQFIERLSDEQKEFFYDEAAKAGDNVRQCIEDLEAEKLAEWEESGVWKNIVEPGDIDLDAFRQRAADQLPAEFADTWGDIYDQIRELAE